MTLDSLGYLIAALAYGVAAWRAPLGMVARRKARIRLALATCSAWAAVLAAVGSTWSLAQELLWVALPAEIFFFGALLLLLDVLNDAPPTYWLRRAILSIWIGALILVLLAQLKPVFTPFSRLAGLILSMACLASLEQLFRNSTPAAARAIKFCVVGFGGQIAYDLFLYSQAQLLGGFHVLPWALRGFVFAALMALAAVGLRRIAKDQPAIFVSRQVVFYTTALLGVGIYLVVMAIGGYYVRMHGGIWGEHLQLLFFVGAVVLLALLVLSPSLWRRLRVFVAKHFFRNKYDYRVEWLRFIDTLSGSDGGDVRETSIRAIAQILESPGGVLFLKEEGRGVFSIASSWFQQQVDEQNIPSLPAAHDIARFLAERQWVVDLNEWRCNPALYQNIKLPDWIQDPQARWGIITPLFELDRLIGFLVLLSPPPPFQMTFEDRDLLRTVGCHVATLLAQHDADQKLAEARQFEAFHRFSAFVMHDLKNSVAQLQLIVANAARHRDNPQFMEDAIDTIGNTAARMTKLIEQLGSPAAATLVERVDLISVVETIAKRCASRPPGVRLEGAKNCPADVAVAADGERLTAVLEHVVRNAQEAAGGHGNVTLTLTTDSHLACISVRDNGAGMDSTFVRERLFRPFDSTKGAKGMGIGAYQAREYVGQLGGSVEVQSSPGIGTTFLITLPLCTSQSLVS